jgi:hypothetical protein
LESLSSDAIMEARRAKCLHSNTLARLVRIIARKNHPKGTATDEANVRKPGYRLPQRTLRIGNWNPKNQCRSTFLILLIERVQFMCRPHAITLSLQTGNLRLGRFRGTWEFICHTKKLVSHQA